MRAFIAIDLPPETRLALRALQKTLSTAFDGAGLAHSVRWTSIDSIHLTLRFLGETTEAQHEDLARALQATALACAPFDLTLRGLGCFPNLRRPNVVWTGVHPAAPATHPAPAAHPAHPALLALQAPLEQAARNEGFDPETRPFSPHLTLGRFRREAAPADLGRAGALVQELTRDPAVLAWRAPLPVTEVVFFQSDLRPSGAIYTALDRFTLAGKM